MSVALLVIDVQRALCEGEHATFDADGVIARINLAAARARATGNPVVFVQHETAEGAFRHKSEGWQLARGLDVQPGDTCVRKAASDSFHRTELAAVLERLGVTRLAVCGMQSDFCVDTTTRRALALGYPVQLIADGHTTVDNGVLPAALITRHHTATLTNISSFGVRAVAVSAAELAFGR